MKPLLTTELALSVQEALDGDGCCEMDGSCTRTACWWAVNPCGCRVLSCTHCRASIDLINHLVALSSTPYRFQCVPCGVEIAVQDITFKAFLR